MAHGTQTQLFAHYTASRSRKELYLTETPSLLNLVEVVVVAGKAEARRIADERHAVCWNF